MFRKETVLELTAHGHDLLKKLLYPMSIKIVMGKGLDGTDLFLFPCLVKHLLTGLNLILCHLPGYLHTLFIQLYDTGVNLINLLP